MARPRTRKSLEHRQAPAKKNAPAPAPAKGSTGPGRPSRKAAPPGSQETTRQSRAVQDETVGNSDDDEDDPAGIKGFESYYPALDLESYIEQLDKWSLSRLKKALADQKYPRRNRPPPEIVSAAKGLVRDREKVVIMLALIGGCREGLIRKEL